MGKDSKKQIKTPRLLVEALITLSKESYEKSSTKRQGLEYIEIYKKNCSSYTQSDLQSLSSAIHQLDVDRVEIANVCKSYLRDLLGEDPDKYAFLNRGILSSNEIKEGVVILLNPKQVGIVDLSKSTTDVKVLLLTGKDAGSIINWSDLSTEIIDKLIG